MTWTHLALLALPVVQVALLIAALRIYDHFNPLTRIPDPELTDQPKGE